MVIITFTSEVMEAVRGQKPSSDGKKNIKEYIFWEEHNLTDNFEIW
jgi:hypothetical protein